MVWLSLALIVGVFVMIAHYNNQTPEDMDRSLQRRLPPEEWQKILRQREESRQERERIAEVEREYRRHRRDNPPIP
jgi:hypothetical protein